MDEKVLDKLATMTERIYVSIMGRVKDGFFSIWNPRFQELNRIMDALLSDYDHCTRGKVLENHYDSLVAYQKKVNDLPTQIFEMGNLSVMELLQEELPKELGNIKASLKKGIDTYDQIEARVHQVDDYEKEFIDASSRLVDDYKQKLRNRIQQNIGRVRQFDMQTEEERRYFMTHVLFFDEGKLENTILEYLNEAERKVEEEVMEVERRAIISSEVMSMEESREYVHRYRMDTGKQSPKELSISRKLQEEEAIEDKFETWFNNLIGENSSVGKLINERKKSLELPIEEQMFEAMEKVVDGNLGNLSMTEMLDAYKEECVMIKEKSFEEFYGKYDEINNLIFVLDKALQLFPEWDIHEVGIGDIILGKY